MIKVVLYIVVVLFGFLNGYILIKLCKDEISKWRRIFLYLAIISLVLITLLYSTNFEYKLPIILSLMFFIITCFVIWKKN